MRHPISLVLCFADESMNIREDLIKFVYCKWGLSGADLATEVLNTLHDLRLNVQNCEGQGYDGIGSVAGHINGLSSHISSI